MQPGPGKLVNGRRAARHSGTHARRESADDGLGDVGGGRAPAHIPGHDATADDGVHGGLDQGGGGRDGDVGVISPSHCSSMATDITIPSGLAMPWPAMSGADPCAACAIAYFSPALIRHHPQRARELTGEIGERVAEQVLGDDHVEGLGRRTR